MPFINTCTVGWLKHLILVSNALCFAVKVDLAQSYVQDLEKQLAVAQHKLRDSGASQFETEALKLQLDQAKSKIKVRTTSLIYIFFTRMFYVA